MATDRVGMGSDDLHARIAQLEAQLHDVNERATQAANAEPPTLPDPVPQGPDPLLLARIDELAARIDHVGANAAGDADLARRVDELSARVGTTDPELAQRVDELAGRVALTPDHSGRLNDLESRLAVVADPANRADAAPHADTLRRLDELDQRLGALDTLSAQITQLSARVAGQAEFGAQLSSLRDRITEIQSTTDERQHSLAAAAVAATADAELRDRVNALADRLTATEALSTQMGQLAERLTTSDASARQTADQVSLLDQRVQAVATELTNQISELGRDIDGLAAHQNETVTSTVSDDVIAALRTSQVRLANEQARYEIAFRQDLANLAEHLRQQRR
jgi:tetrahydromethanopterin S-methyltransferase subunit G